MDTENHFSLNAAPQHWTWRCVPNDHDGAAPCPLHHSRLADVELLFAVSRDEEYVQLRAVVGHRVHDLGARNHNYLLLTLARRRLVEQEAGLCAGESGWVGVDELAHDRTMGGPRLNVDVFRIRRQFTDLGLIDGKTIVERRATTAQLRIGTSRVRVARV